MNGHTLQAIANVMADRAAAAATASPGKANTADFTSPLMRGESSSISKKVA